MVGTEVRAAAEGSQEIRPPQNGGFKKIERKRPAVEPVSLTDGGFRSKLYAVLVPITRWATNEITANNSSR